MLNGLVALIVICYTINPWFEKTNKRLIFKKILNTNSIIIVIHHLENILGGVRKYRGRLNSYIEKKNIWLDFSYIHKKIGYTDIKIAYRYYSLNFAAYFY